MSAHWQRAEQSWKGTAKGNAKSWSSRVGLQFLAERYTGYNR